MKCGHDLSSNTNQWTNPWHKNPPDWRANRETKVTDDDIEMHTDMADRARDRRNEALKKNLEKAEDTAVAQAQERIDYSQKTFLGKAFHPSTPYLRARHPDEDQSESGATIMPPSHVYTAAEIAPPIADAAAPTTATAGDGAPAATAAAADPEGEEETGGSDGVTEVQPSSKAEKELELEPPTREGSPETTREQAATETARALLEDVTTAATEAAEEPPTREGTPTIVEVRPEAKVEAEASVEPPRESPETAGEQAARESARALVADVSTAAEAEAAKE
eukprot:m.133716 g.133716  ORF g.133716 m.133716 type:complete len:279 (-) comp13846_c0_seq1:105-941(-)